MGGAAKMMGAVAVVMWVAFFCCHAAEGGRRQLRFDGKRGEFRILQVADMHYADGKRTLARTCFRNRWRLALISTPLPSFAVLFLPRNLTLLFSLGTIFGFDATDAASSMNAAFAPAVSSNIPWAAVLGNHDQESTLSREVHGVEGSRLENKSVLNLYFLDSGDYSTVPSIPGYGWIKPSQQLWFERTSSKLQRAYVNKPEPQKGAAPGLTYFHIPLPEFASFDSSNFTGVKQEGISSASVNSGFFTTMVAAGDGKDGGSIFGENRERIMGTVKSIKTWKRLDDEHLTAIDGQVLWSKSSSGKRKLN
ncbi:UNVERIFIED_CONTAM: putative inactive purple acid phosphatase 29 [Sesamum latifolium]|uniref:Inactive purple acid phosphatase 29 n=1 Tax=Sesamum latifolium TaxID=2727402 RepID=A0AAW2WDG5_9LAMI